MRSGNSGLTQQVLPRPLFTVTLRHAIIIIIINIVPIRKKEGANKIVRGLNKFGERMSAPKFARVKIIIQAYRNLSKLQSRNVETGQDPKKGCGI